MRTTFKQFQETRVEMTPKSFAEEHGSYEDEHSNAKIVHSYGGWYIDEHADGKFHVIYQRTDWICDSLLEAEAIFWGEFASGELNAYQN